MADPLVLISGPCVIEDEGLVLEVAEELKIQLADTSFDFYFKASFDKANRTSIEGFRGPGLVDGLKILEKVKSKTGLKLLTDFHEPHQAEAVAEVVDYLQVPAFLCRQTDTVIAGAKAVLKQGKKLNVKKGQFLAPTDVKNIVAKVDSLGDELKMEASAIRELLSITERGASFGYNSLIVDMSSFQIIQQSGVKAIYDITHSIQRPGAGQDGKSTGGKREILESLARAAVAAGADGIFLECHPRPSEAKSDGPNAFYLEHMGKFVRQLDQIHKLVSQLPKILPESQ